MKHRSFLSLSISIALLTVLFVGSCKKPDLKMSTTNDVNAASYLKEHSDSFSLWTQILERTETSDFLDAYGSYTVFAPTNEGVEAWLNSIGAGSVDAADIELLKNVVRFHILEDTITTPAFRDGKLPVPTMYGQFLITGVKNDGGTSSYTVNRQAAVVRSNIKVGNGYVQEIDHVLVPAKLTIAEELAANNDYSIFVEALKATGFYDKLNTVDPDSSKRWKTVIAESNRALADSGITTFDQLKTRYSNTGNPTDPLDSLNLYVAYHILDGIYFLGDIITDPSHLTLQPQEVISTKLINNEVYVNDDEFNGVHEPGILLIRDESDNAATNGVWHSADAHFASKFRKPTAVYWDLCTFPEIVKMPAYYQTGTYTFYKSSQDDHPIKDIDWEYHGENYVRYMWGSSGSLFDYAYNHDILTIPLGAPSNNNRARWVEFKTPPIIKGKYKVWICYRERNRVILNVRVDDQLMMRPVNMGEGKPAGSDAELESLGWKRYTLGGKFSGRMVGVVDIQTTDRHILRFEPIEGTNRDIHFDMVHFIPIDQNQYLPRFAPDGTEVWQ